MVGSTLADTNASESVTIHLRCLQMPKNRFSLSYDASENTKKLLRIIHDFSEWDFVAKILNSSKLLPQIPNCSRITSGTDNDSATNPKIYQFVVIGGIRGLCGIGA